MVVHDIFTPSLSCLCDSLHPERTVVLGAVKDAVVVVGDAVGGAQGRVVSRTLTVPARR